MFLAAIIAAMSLSESEVTRFLMRVCWRWVTVIWNGHHGSADAASLLGSETKARRPLTLALVCLVEGLILVFACSAVRLCGVSGANGTEPHGGREIPDPLALEAVGEPDPDRPRLS